ncbi:MAG: glycosyltransferase [Candidatus Eisenbacteria bacterium]|nr:glycosyltransferase [Candidatus Eisenbacteria bacterium]
MVRTKTGEAGTRAKAKAKAKRTDLLVFSEVKWNYMRTRKRFILSRFPKDWRILFFEPISSSVSNNFLPKRDGNVIYVSTPILKPQTESKIYNRLIERKIFRDLLGLFVLTWVRVVMWFLGVRADADVLISSIYFVPVVRRLRSSFVCYDCNDDPTVFPGVRDWSREYFRRLCRRADVIVACSQSLADRVGSFCGKTAIVIGNGVDYDLFASKVSREALPDDIARMKGPIVGYTGAIKEWFDFSLVAQAARANPQASFALIGPVAPGVREEALALAQELENVRFLGEKAYEALPLYLAGMSVCLIPFKMSALTSVLNPNKLYEYFAAGKTVVSLKYSEDLAKYEGLMYLVDEPSRFGATVTRALRETVEPGKVMEIAARNSWRVKAREMVELLERKGKSAEV